ncbi:hypothetical protein BN1708_015025, partial [Verticillium longisporum]
SCNHHDPFRNVALLDYHPSQNPHRYRYVAATCLITPPTQPTPSTTIAQHVVAAIPVLAMTSRTPMGVQPRPPQQRTLSSSGLTVQRPPHQRTLSAQYLPPSPVRKEPSNLIDLTGDSNDVAVAQNRYGTVPRRGGSRLKLELSNDSTLFQPATESPQNLTPSRLVPKNDASSLADTNSPASTRAGPLDNDNPPMPMPKRRPRFALPTPPKDTKPAVIATKKDGRPKPYSAEIPPDAPRYAPLNRPKADATKVGYGTSATAKESHDMGNADFFSWTGNHPEDRLSDAVIKNGYFDKAPVTQAETTSAKPAIFPALKHKNGLNLLSSIFVGVLNQRKHNGQVVAPSAFKPPPRVTLTDTKREVWMRDLANPAISLPIPVLAMTSRTPMGVQPRPPQQRTLSSSGLTVQRPPHQRTLSAQYLPPSPVRKEPSNLIDLTGDSNDAAVAQNRYGTRRPRFALPTPPKDTTPAVIATKKDGRPKPYSAEIPPDAPRYAPLNRPKADATKVGYGTSATAKESHDMGNADFFSWTGNHPEDRLSDAVIKNGYFDKAPVTQAETTSAKPAIFPALKHKNGLNLLSSIFVGVLNQRKHNGQVVAPSAFKPPPRVTLTDTKREVWMRDLANPAISLRRLSRTIPHGIRGKGLLDHCLNKNVPTERAVWLVRCVGANDLRTVKRKGVNGTVVMGGEAKWLKDWTLYVEQFVESVASAFGEVDWKARVQYAIRLATHLYAEHLVDRDHYMDWLVGGLENSTQSKLPMWILISQIYWKDLLRLRRHGRRLANALLSHLTTIQNDPDRDILAQLSTKLTSLLLPLLSSYPDNFLSPTTWLRCRETLLASIPIDNDAVLSAYKALNSRNEILIASSGKSQPANRQILIKQLDTTFQTLYTNELASSCWNVSEDKGMIVRTVLEWSTSFYRPGQARIYVAASLLRAWASTGVDITTAILESIGAAPPQGTTPKRLFYQLISELVRTGQFNVREYAVWLMGRGGMTSSLDTEPDAPCSTRLLIDLPLSALSSSFIATRANLLRRAAFDVAEEARDIDAAWNFIRHALGLSSNAEVSPVQRRPMPLAKICRAVSNSSRALQTEVGARLLQIFQTDEYESSSDMHLSPTAFNHARSILEAAKDFTTMAEMIKLTSRFPDADILASCADTVNVHLATFAAMNVARNLCDLLLERMKIVNDEQGVRVRPLLVALGALTARLPGLANTIRLATHLYAEHLVDRDHYMDWLVGGLENSTQSKLPMWILISQIYWKDLLRLRRHGRRLANALLSHLTTIQNDPDRDILAQLSTKLTSLLLPLLSSYPDNFLSPTTWLRCRETLLASIPIDNDAVLSAYKALNSRNEVLIASSGKSQPANRQILIKQLDTTFQTLYTNELASSCWNVSEDKRMIVRTVLEWSTSFYRPGQARIYVAASLLRAWASTGVDITTAILESIGTAPPQGTTPKRLFYQLISELVRTGQFNVREYVVWLMGRGGMTSSLDTEPDAPCSTRLLIDLPLSALSSSFIATRANLLRRAAFDVAEEARDIDAAWDFIRHALGLSSDAEISPAQRRPMPLAKICRAVSNSSRALQTEVGARLLQIFQTDDYESSSDVHLSPTAFNHARSILEAAKDFTTMAEMIKLTSRFPDADILASCADTVNVHLPTFAAMNVARNLCDLLLERMKIVNDEQGVRVRPLLVALGALTARLPGLANTSAHLRKELQQIDQSTAIDACSPVSDNMAARLQDAEGELNDEIERLLTGGTSLDRPTMDRLFHTVVTRLEGSWVKDSEKQHAYSALLARLRIFDTQHFDVRMTDWVHHVSIMKTRPTLFDIYPFLISLGCLGLSTIMTTTTIDPSKVVGGQVGCASTYMQEVLQLVVSPLPPKNPLSQEEAYRFYVQQRVAPQQHHRELAVLIRNSLIEYSKLQNSEMSTSAPLARQDLQDDVLDLLRLLVLNDSPTTVQVLGTKLADSPLSEGSWVKDSEKQHAYSALLARLRIFDTQHFDVRMTDWVHHVSIMKTRPTLFDIYPFLISLGCLGLSTIMTTTTIDPSKVVGGQVGCTSTYMQEVLQLVVSPLPPKNALSQEEAYRFYVQQRVAPQQYHRELAVLIRNSLIEYSKLQNSEVSTSAPLARQDLRDDVLDLLRLLVLNDSPTTVQVLGTKLADSPLSEVLASITTRLLAPTRDPNDPMTFETVLELANDFTLPFCQLKLSIGLAASKAGGSSGDEQPASHVDMLSKALDQAVETKNMMWTSVLPYLSEEITDHLKRQAQTRLFSLVPSLKTMSTAGDSSEDTIRLSESLLSVVEAIIRGRPALKATQLNMSMVDKLTELWELLAATELIGKDLRMAIIEHWLPLLLKFITLHTTASEPVLSPTQPASMKPPTTAAANDVRARMLVVLSGIMLELDNISCEEARSGRQLRQTTFDLALFLVDHLPEESRLQCVRAILIGGSLQAPITSDAGIRYLFSYAAPWMEQFMLAHRQTPTPPSNGPPRPKIPISVQGSARLTPYIFRRWELLSEPSPIVGENDTALSLSLFEAIKIQ